MPCNPIPDNPERTFPIVVKLEFPALLAWVLCILAIIRGFKFMPEVGDFVGWFFHVFTCTPTCTVN